MERDLGSTKARTHDGVNVGIQKRAHKKTVKWKYMARKPPYEDIG